MAEVTQEQQSIWELQERKERVAYRLNCMLFSVGVNVSGQFREE